MSIKDNLGHYQAQVLRVVDGDTCEMKIEVFPKIYIVEKVRFLGIDTPELKSQDQNEKDRAYKARDYTEGMLEGKQVIIKTTEKDVFGRFLAIVYLGEMDFNQHLIDKGYARTYVRKS